MVNFIQSLGWLAKKPISLKFSRPPKGRRNPSSNCRSGSFRPGPGMRIADAGLCPRDGRRRPSLHRRLALRLRSGLHWTAEAALPTSAFARLARGLHDGSDAFGEVREIGDQLWWFVDFEIDSEP